MSVGQYWTLKDPFEYLWILKVENWKYCNKIIFKCVNSVLETIFNESLLKKEVCESREQCTRPTGNVKRSSQQKRKKSETQTLNAKCCIQTDT